LIVSPRALNNRVQDFRLVWPEGITGFAGFADLLILGRLSRTFQLIDARLIRAPSRQPVRVYRVKADVGAISDTDDGLEGLFHSLRDSETAFTKIKNGFSSGQAVLLFNGIQEGQDFCPTAFRSSTRLFAIDHLQQHFTYRPVGHTLMISVRSHRSELVHIVKPALHGLCAGFVGAHHLLQM